ncbi:hypothetical protein BKA93DRAFT_522463 [Sparassis latifolia]|uniref:Uncharacterized protein n=1 Tax=Sparassis crispa TaxID=139825 RepID=A0A401GKZ6_9APHY|nr:hypothetical protein SCP_0412170 [Sparassis crispa]GBE82830.1 hypothetical protein SCP_0412170 [Sparassis crispa]
MSAPLALNHDENVYLTVTITSSSPFAVNPAALVVHPSLTHLGMVGQLRDVQLLSVPRESWPRLQGEVLSALNALDGVRRVDVQDPPRMRAKRGGDEL